MKYQISHTTRYDYDETVPICYNLAHLSPRDFAQQRTLQWDLIIEPSSALYGKPRADYFGNAITYFTVQEPHHRLTITMNATVEVTPRGDIAMPYSPGWETVAAKLRGEQDPGSLDAYQYLFDSRFVSASPALQSYAALSFQPERPLLECAMDLTQRVYSDFTYDTAATTVSTPLDEVMRARRGVCQDFAHLEIGCLRSMGVPARYVSGYIYSGPIADEPHRIGGQASHAWVSVYCPKNGWVDFDPTNNMTPKGEHITIGWGRDYDDVAPVRGVVLGGGEHTISVAVDVRLIG